MFKTIFGLLLLGGLGIASANEMELRDGSLMSQKKEEKYNLGFVCAHERKVPVSEESDKVFNYARYLEKNNILRRDEETKNEIERLYRIAAEHEHYKALVNLQNGAMRGRFKLQSGDYYRYSKTLIDKGVATGYLFVGIYLKNGMAGFQKDEEAALQYYRKAADEGSAEAQYFIGGKLDPVDMAPDVAVKMYRCAAEQGHGEAALTLGIHLRGHAKLAEAVEAFQMGVRAGDSTSGFLLSEGFKGRAQDKKRFSLNLPEDAERARRYEKIFRLLSGWSYANPKVPDIDEIVPLPPAPLPAWDGTLKWVEERKANVSPEKPTEALIHKLANAKGLDPVTGKPMPGSPAFSNANFPVRLCVSGQPCPEAGYWKVIWPPYEPIARPEVIQHFNEGEPLPVKTVERFHRRPWPLKDYWTRAEESVQWGLMG